MTWFRIIWIENPLSLHDPQRGITVDFDGLSPHITSTLNAFTEMISWMTILFVFFFFRCLAYGDS